MFITALNNSYNINTLNPVHYYNTVLQKEDIGFIAHELQESYPLLVRGEKDGETLQTVNFYGLIPILVNEIKQLKNDITELKKKLDLE